MWSVWIVTRSDNPNQTADAGAVCCLQAVLRRHHRVEGLEIGLSLLSSIDNMHTEALPNICFSPELSEVAELRKNLQRHLQLQEKAIQAADDTIEMLKADIDKYSADSLRLVQELFAATSCHVMSMRVHACSWLAPGGQSVCARVRAVQCCESKKGDSRP
eukprot:6488559-Amphidinium_carterae.1